VLLALSGSPLFHPRSLADQSVRRRTWTRILHPFIECVMAAAFYLLCVKFWA